MIRPGCHNKPRPTADKEFTVQDGYTEYEERGYPVRIPKYIRIKYRNSTECQYDMRATDAKCGGCVSSGVNETALK